MNCKGCIHCILVSKIDEPYLKASFHYCDIHSEYDSIGQAYKWCEGRDYENEETRNFRKYLERNE